MLACTARNGVFVFGLVEVTFAAFGAARARVDAEVFAEMAVVFWFLGFVVVGVVIVGVVVVVFAVARVEVFFVSAARAALTGGAVGLGF